jgi:hypothetical protein
LELPVQLSGVHDVFHVSQLKKCTSEVRIEPILLEDIEMGKDLTYKEYPIKILNTSERVTRRKVIRMCKVQLSHHTEEEQPGKERMNSKKIFLSCSLNLLNLGARFSLRG